MQSIYKLPLVFEPQPEGGYTVRCPVLPELISEGDTIKETLTNASDALAAIIETYEDIGRPLPAVLKKLADNAPVWTETLLSVGSP